VQIHQCLQVPTGKFDVDEVEALFSERRAVLLDTSKDAKDSKGFEPFKGVVLQRVRQYLAEKAARRRPLNGVLQSTGKLAGRIDGVKRASALAPVASPVTKTSPPVTETVTKTEPVTKTPSKGGRPKKEGALSAAEKQRAYRGRLKT